MLAAPSPPTTGAGTSIIEGHTILALLAAPRTLVFLLGGGGITTSALSLLGA